MTTYAYAWRCPRCGNTYRSPIAVISVACTNHPGAPVAMRADDEEESYADPHD